MSLRSLYQPTLASVVTSRRLRSLRRSMAEMRRRVSRAPHRARIYLRLEDPYSFVLAQVLAELAGRFDVELEPVAIRDLQIEMVPDPERLAAWARTDAGHLAALYGLEAPGARPGGGEADSLAFAEATERGIDETLAVMRAWWAGQDVPPATDPDAARAQLERGDARLRGDGHYMAAMIHYGGEWYWGIDRLNHLEERWIAAGLARDSGDAPRFVKRLSFLETPATPSAASEALIFYWSARSPYAYLAVDRARRLANAFGVPLDIRPVLPMVMRNLAVPRTKRFYILLDAKREADLLDIPLGRICDPVGAGIERCYALLDLAREHDRLAEWVQEFATQVWSEGVDAATDRGIATIAERAGLPPEAAIARCSDESWRQDVERHRLEMLEAGFWGVPIFVYKDTAVWGQDRFWVLEAAMRAEAS